MIKGGIGPQNLQHPYQPSQMAQVPEQSPSYVGLVAIQASGPLDDGQTNGGQNAWVKRRTALPARGGLGQTLRRRTGAGIRRPSQRRGYHDHQR